MMGNYSMMQGNWMIVLIIGAFWVILSLVIVWFILAIAKLRPPAAPIDAQEILRQRFARGEISREEFEQARDVLRSQPVTP